MTQNLSGTWWAKLVLLVTLVATAGVYVYPTLANLNPETSKFPFKQKINLGLDLQGGLYLVLGVDFSKVNRDVLDRQASSVREAAKTKLDLGVKLVHPAKVDATKPELREDPSFVMEFDAARRDAVHAWIKKDFWTLRIVGETAGRFELGIARDYRQDVRERTIGQSIEVIRNRIDEFGVSEPAISSQGTDRVVVELPGVKDVDRAKDLIGKTAKLEFKIVDDKVISPGQLADLVAELEKKNSITYREGQKFSEYVQAINAAAKGKIPEGREIAFERASPSQGTEGPGGARPAGMRLPYLLISQADVTGDDLQDAHVSPDPETQRPNVSFEMNPRGADALGKVTEAHKGQRMAIVLDGIVQSAPVIQSKISDRGQITLGQLDYETLMREAKDLAIVLRAGALPAQLEFLEQRVVGPSLGQDSIAKGARASIIGCLLVFAFMMFYYRASGVVAVISLLLNFLFSFAILVGLEATLTLPGIAGLALTIGMAVDSNVIIFERIRDELLEGKSVAGAVEAGFQRAFAAIFDANLTHGIIGAILMYFGTGPIRGFAITLLIGIFTTLFCAVTVCKLIFDGYIALKREGELKTLSI